MSQFAVLSACFFQVIFGKRKKTQDIYQDTRERKQCAAETLSQS